MWNMPSFDTRERTEEYYEILMKKPVSVGEMYRAFSVMRQTLASLGKATDTDDYAWITHDDDHIILQARIN